MEINKSITNPTFTITLKTKPTQPIYENLNLENTLNALTEFLANYSGNESDIDITSDDTGEIINDCKYFLTNSNQQLTIFELLELTPYYNLISPITYSI